MENGVELYDINNPNYQPLTPFLHHFRSMTMGDVHLYLHSVWERCIDEDVQLPASYVRTYTKNGDASK